jgi:parvulin-like peptidyl-prolyl isomerase
MPSPEHLAPKLRVAAACCLLLPLAWLNAGLSAATAPGAPAGGEEVNRIVLRVNDEIFTLFDYELRKARRSAQLLNDPSISPAQRQEALASLGKEVMQAALYDMLLASQAKRAAVTVSDQEIDASIDQIKKEQGIETDEDFKMALSQAGLTLEELRANFRREMSTGRLVQKEVTAKIEVDEDQMRAYYRNHPDEFRTPEERKLREVIVLEASGLPDAELKQMAAKLQQELSAPGAKGAEVVGRYQDQGYSSSLIDLGWLKKGELEKSLSDAAWGLEVGRYAAPIKARGGYHVVFLEEKRGGELQPYADVQNQIQGRERQKRFSKEYRSYMAQLEKGSYIQENPPAEAVGYRSFLQSTPEEDELKAFRAPLAPEEPAAGTKVGEAPAAPPGPAVTVPAAVAPADPTPRDATPTDGVPTSDNPAHDGAAEIPIPTGSGGSGGNGGG